MRIRAKGGSPLMNAPLQVAVRLLSQGATPAELRRKHENPSQGLNRKVRVLAVVHGWMPYLAAGSERMMQHMLDALPREEFEVAVLSFGVADTRFEKTPYEYQGLPVYVGYQPPFAPDIIITHHGPGARVSQAIAQEYPNSRVVAVYHNERYDIPDIEALDADLSVYNTEWVRKALDGSGIVVHPPLEFERHVVEETGSAVTLVNLQENKGVHVFHALAELMPDTRFLGVEGTHGKQEYRRDLKNIEYLPVTQDMRHVWRKSRIVLMPSGYESYGMVAAEACVNGIPVVAHPTPGLVECLGSAGNFIPRDQIPAWERTVRLLLEDRKKYQERSDSAALHGLALEDQTKRELAAFTEEVRKLA